MNYTKHFNTRQTGQRRPMPGKAQVKNEAGGYVFQVDDWKRLERFLILGTEGGTYYTNEQKLTVDNANAVMRCLKADGLRTVKTIVEISDQGRAPKNDPALFALAMCAGAGDRDTRKAALSALPQVARIGTHLFHFAQYVEGFRGWGRGLREAVAHWYLSQRDLPYQAVKYQQRDGWGHRDLLRLSHPKSEELNSVFKWIVKGEVAEGLPDLIIGFEKAKASQNEGDVIGLINQYRLPWEAVPTQWLGSADVWSALLPKLPLTAMLRNLGRLTANGTLKPFSENIGLVISNFANPEYIHKSRLHPMAILDALKVYEQGRGEKGSLSWQPLAPVIDALDKAFYLAFQNVAPTGKRVLFAIDASGSMDSAVNGTPYITCRQAAVALSLVNVAIEPQAYTIAFTEGQHVVTLLISGRMRLMDAMRELERRIHPQGTDCSLPILYAMQNNLTVDAFVILTDNQTWAGNIHPTQAMEQYRHKFNPQAKVVVQAMAANGHSLNDPNDFLSLDVVGFDTSTPQVISDFIKNG